MKGQYKFRYFNLDNRFLEIPEYGNLMEELGTNGVGYMIIIMSIFSRHYKGNPSESIEVRNQTFKRDLFTNKPKWQYLEKVLNTLGWQYEKTETSYIFKPNNFTKTFKKYTNDSDDKSSVSGEYVAHKSSVSGEYVAHKSSVSGEYVAHKSSVSGDFSLQDTNNIEQNVLDVDHMSDRWGVEKEEEKEEEKETYKKDKDKSLSKKRVLDFDVSKFSEWDFKMATIFLSIRKQMSPNDRRLDKININEWTDVFYKLRTLDKQQEGDIEKCMQFVFNDKFWPTVILTPKKLRVSKDGEPTYFEKIMVRANGFNNIRLVQTTELERSNEEHKAIVKSLLEGYELPDPTKRIAK